MQHRPTMIFDKHKLQSSIIKGGDKSAFWYHKGISSSTGNQPNIMIKSRLLNILQLKTDNGANTAFNTWRPQEMVGTWLGTGTGQCKIARLISTLVFSHFKWREIVVARNSQCSKSNFSNQGY